MAGFLVWTLTSLGAAIPAPPGPVGVYRVLTVLALLVCSGDTRRSRALVAQSPLTSALTRLAL